VADSLTKISLPTSCVSFSPPKNPILPQILSPKSSVNENRTFEGKIGFLGGEKETQRVGKEIFVAIIHSQLNFFSKK
jgi:hypothetical protein